MTEKRGNDRRQGGNDVEQERRQQERRRWTRVPVHLWAEHSDGEATYFAQVADLSAGGVFFATPLPQPVGTVVAVKLELPDADGASAVLEVRGVVVNASIAANAGMGVRFVELAPEDEAVLLRAMQFLARPA